MGHRLYGERFISTLKLPRGAKEPYHLSFAQATSSKPDFKHETYLLSKHERAKIYVMADYVSP